MLGALIQNELCMVLNLGLALLDKRTSTETACQGDKPSNKRKAGSGK